MDFFEAQEQAKRRTGLLIVLFGAAMVAIAAGIYLVVLVTLGLQVSGEPEVGHGVLFLGVAGVTWTVIALASFFRTAQLRQGGPAVATLLGGREVTPDTRDPDERRLVNVVEEMSIASGTPVPTIFVMDREPSINAFAAGYSIHDAAVAVTRGTLERLDRDELQGVIAHEFSHILNGDMRLNIRLMGILFGILFLAVVGRGVLRGGAYGRRSRGSGQAMAIGLALMALGYLGLFFGRLIKAAVSRQREFLADAAAVQFTRNPGGIGGALRKIAGHPEKGRIDDHHAEEASHLFFADGLASSLSRAMATHPPLEERIHRIDPTGMAAAVPGSAPAAAARATGEAPGPGAGTGAAGEAGKGMADVSSPERLAGAMIAAGALMGSVGDPAPGHLHYARRLLARIPERVREAAHDPGEARALILALIGNGDERVGRARAREAERLGLTSVDELRGLLDEAGPEARLPLLDMALPALRSLDPGEAAAFRSAVQEVIRSDGEIQPFDLALVHILWRHLPDGPSHHGGGRRATQSLKSLRAPLRVLLSTVARSGADDEPGAEDAFRAGLERLPSGVAEGMFIGPSAGARLSELDEALERLERGTMEARRHALDACAAAVLADREVRTEELELLRAVAESLELPLPPVLGGGEPGRE